jgi:hypothetical protein
MSKLWSRIFVETFKRKALNDALLLATPVAKGAQSAEGKAN